MERCEICGELITERQIMTEGMGEFVQPDGTHVLAHAQCGLDQGLELA